VNNVVVEELPSQCNVVRSFGRGSKNEFAKGKVFQKVYCFLRVDILELRVIDSSRLESAYLLHIIVKFEGLVDQVLRIVINLRELLQILFMLLELASLAVK